MFEMWVESMLLAVEAQGVIAQRLVKLAACDAEAVAESHQMVSEKVSALIEATGTLLTGGGMGAVVARYREHVAANALRLAPPAE
ncbi:conserved hypothetical protein; putative signal peptide [Methylobacterium sp. 4-46]|uniref:hypothetical protein n=1 Tax=unclassified Methylobacterium TaxID=2615210 RepID=UPI000152CB82|nr:MULTISPECIES: hypothetical protein [Methylobacterium]ACA14614.1 conserved hypothetical protein; putative signal peptide [Methylobacterium sp. 4-46]WFT80368.1 hypothetical protein QA634_00130 [Methylobacterium nodulans]